MPLLVMIAWLLLPALGAAQPAEPPPVEPGERAEPPARVEVALPECASVALDVARLVELLRIELVSDGVAEVVIAAAAPGSPPEGAPVALVRIDADPCAAGSLRFRIAIDDLATRKHVEREIDLADVAESMRARVLALSAAELLRASWAELLLDPATASVAPSVATLGLRDAMRVRLAASSALGTPPTVSSEPRRPPPPPRTRQPEPPAFLLDAALAVASFPGARTSLLGASVGLDLRLVAEPRLSLRIDAQFGVGSSLDPLGRIDLGFAGGGVALRISLARPSFMVGVGPRLVAGWGWARGDAYAEDTIASNGGTAVVLATIEAAGAVRIAGRLWATLALEAGGTLRGLEALVASIPVAGVDGSMIGARLGLALRL